MTTSELHEQAHKPKTIEIVINGTTYSVTERDMTGAQLKALGHVPHNEALFRKHGHGEDRIDDNETVKLHEHDEFESGPDGGVS